MKIAMAQINSALGDFKSNSEKILNESIKAHSLGCDIVVFPECALFGYAINDLLERHSVYQEQEKHLNKLVKKLPKDIYIFFGAVTENKKKGKKYFNSAILVYNNKIKKTFSKQLLPSYDVFDETRHFEKGQLQSNIVKIKGKNILVGICEDIWGWDEFNPDHYQSNPISKIKDNVDLFLVLNASPFVLKKDSQRRNIAKACANRLKCDVVYVNLVGGQDELIFDGGSFAVDKSGELTQQALVFQEDLCLTYSPSKKQPNTIKRPPQELYESLRQGLVLGLRDFVEKIGLKKVHFGLSGGVDSALIACLAADALGPANVTGIAMPGPHSSKLSFNLAEKLARNIGIEFKTIEINNSYKAMLGDLESGVGKAKFGLTNENLQARIRGALLMGFSNREGSLLINTSNKSELAVGYSTLYGDLCGGISPIGDLTKSQVFGLCEHYNKEMEIIPEKIITRPPSAELRPNQKDSDSLPDYQDLDKSVVNIVEKRKKATTKTDQFVLEKLFRNEFKRWQAPPVLRISEHAFGQGRRMPIANNCIK